MHTTSIWDKFTNLYSVSKTLRFELRPVGKTEENIIKKGIIDAQWIDGKNVPSGEDAKRAEDYKIAKRLMNQMHSLFIDEALSRENIKDFEKEETKSNTPKKKIPTWEELLVDHFQNWQESRKKNKSKPESIEKILEKSKGELYKKFGRLLNYSGNKWKEEFVGYHKKRYPDSTFSISASNIEILYKNTSDPVQLLIYQIELGKVKLKTEEGVEYSQGQMLEVLRSFEKFGTYFSGFNQNRANVYNIDGEIATSLAYRLFDQNIEFFFLNLERWESIQKKINHPDAKKTLKSKDWNIAEKLYILNTVIVQPRFTKKLDAIFKPGSFIHYFNQEGIDYFNAVLGGIPAEIGKEKDQGLNEIINLTRQKLNADKRDFPSLQIFYKQILSDRKESFIDQFTDEKEMLQSIEEFHNEWSSPEQRELSSGKIKKLNAIVFIRSELFDTFDFLEKNRVLKNDFYLGEKAIQELSIDILGGYNTIHSLWYDEVEAMTKEDGKPIPKSEKEKFKKYKYLSFAKIEELISNFTKNSISNKENSKSNQSIYKESWRESFSKDFSISTYGKTKFDRLILEEYSEKITTTVMKNGKKEEVTIEIPSLLKIAQDKSFLNLLSTKSFGAKKEESIQTLKEYLDACLKVTKFIENFKINDKELKEDQSSNGSTDFLNTVTSWLADDFDMVLLYNKVRNFVTKKPGSTDKIKINFDNATLLDGWDLDKEAANYGFLLTKEDQFYLAIADKSFNQELKNFNEDDREKTIEAKKKELSKEQEKNENKKDIEKIKAIEVYIDELKSIPISQGKYFSKVKYKFMPDVAKMIPKCTTQLKKVVSHFESDSKPYILSTQNTARFVSPLKISEEIFRLNNSVYDLEAKRFVSKIDDSDQGKAKGPKKFQKEYVNKTGDQKGFQSALKKWIDFCLKFTKSYDSCQNFDYSLIKNSSEYSKLDEFYRDLNGVGYVIDFVDISEEYINKKVDEGKLYLFQIYNKDFSPFSKGKENLHTTYWKMLFDRENLKDVVIKLNGQAEVFFRPASVQRKETDKATHSANIPIDNKNPYATKKKSSFKYDITKDKRFTKNKFLFHCPITLNFKAQGNPNINSDIQEALATNSDVNIIGIDRGEKHLLYYTVINQNGEILESGSLNTIHSEYKDSDGKAIPFETPYQQILDNKEVDRKEARVSWKQIDSIKDLKSGYLSHVVHKIAKLIIEYNAIVVLEDLNFGFKRGRFKVEKQVYQKFEKALIEKLNYLVFKDKKNLKEPGSFLNAYQLTEKFVSFEKLRKQSGILFYTTASYTSKVDPVTGFMQNFYSIYKSGEKVKFLSIFKSIVYNGDFFEITYDLSKQSADKGNGNFKSEWTVGSCVDRSEYKPETKSQNCFNVNTRLIELFKEFNLDYKKSENILEKLLPQDEKFIRRFHYLFTAILKMRVVDPKEKKGEDFNDYIQSPVYPYYNSREIAESKDKKNLLPANGDANGAYNIARKGMIILDKIQLKIQIEKLCEIENLTPDWYKINTFIPKIKDRKSLITVFEEWASLTHRGKVQEIDLFNGKNIGEKGEEFLEFVSDLKVSKREWEIYTQNEETVKRQMKVLEKIRKI